MCYKYILSQNIGRVIIISMTEIYQESATGRVYNNKIAKTTHKTQKLAGIPLLPYKNP